MSNDHPIGAHEARMKELERHYGDLEGRMREAEDKIVRLQEQSRQTVDLMIEIKLMLKESNNEMKLTLEKFVEQNAREIEKIDTDKDIKISQLTTEVNKLKNKPGLNLEAYKNGFIAAGLGALAVYAVSLLTKSK